MFLNVMDVAHLLGISRASAYELVRTAEFPKLKVVAGRIIIPRDTLLIKITGYIAFVRLILLLALYIHTALIKKTLS